MYVGISAAGVFQTEDGGETRDAGEPRHSRRLPPRPVPGALASACTSCSSTPRGPSASGSRTTAASTARRPRRALERAGGQRPSSGFGFPLALDHRHPDAAFVIPEESAENRVTCDGRLGVYRTDDGGASWTLLAGGLPQPAWGAVMREGFSSDRLDPAGIYLGTQSGRSSSPRTRATWIEAASQLPPILSVEAAEWR